jgi:hypothetical protein
MGALGDVENVNLKFSLRYAERQARQSFIRSAYLGLFGHLGYGFVFSDAGAFTRRSMSGADIETIRLLTPQVSNVEVTNVDNPLVITPLGTVGYLILIRTDTLHERHHGVILPAPGVNESETPLILREIAEMLNGKECRMQVPKVYPAS